MVGIYGMSTGIAGLTYLPSKLGPLLDRPCRGTTKIESNY